MTIREAANDVAEPLRHTLINEDALVALDQVPKGSCRLVVTSPPYNIGKEYEKDKRLSLDEYIDWLKPIIAKTCDTVADDGSICWQVGNYVNNGEVFPLDYYFYVIFKELGFHLRNRIIWKFNFGLHANRRFSGRYETLLWFTRSDEYLFNLDPVRVPQLYPGKRHAASKGDRGGKPSGNPLGKNPSDVWAFSPSEAFLDDPIWDLPNVKAKHPEKTIHPCSFPSELVERCVLALSAKGDTVLDPFVGTGTTVVAAAMHGRRGIGIDQSAAYIAVAQERLDAAMRGELVTRPLGRTVRQPVSGERVASIPEEWSVAPGEDADGSKAQEG